MTELEDRLRDLQHATVAPPPGDLAARRQRSDRLARRRASRFVAVAAAVVALLVVGAVVTRSRPLELQTVQPAAPDGGGRSATSTLPPAAVPPGTPTFWLDPVRTGAPDDLERTVRILRDRFAALGLNGVQVAAADGAVAVWMPAGSTAAERAAASAVARPGSASIRPVRQLLGDGAGAPLPSTGPTGTAVDPDRSSGTGSVPSPADLDRPDATAVVLRAASVNTSGVGWYEVGPTVVDRSALTAGPDARGGAAATDALSVQIAPGARERWRALVGSCRAHDELCPTGLVAVVVDDAVVATSDPGPDGADDLPVPLARGEGRSASEVLAVVLAGPALPLDLLPRGS